MAVRNRQGMNPSNPRNDIGIFEEVGGGPCRIRTSDHLVMSQTLHLTKLRARASPHSWILDKYLSEQDAEVIRENSPPFLSSGPTILICYKKHRGHTYTNDHV